MTNENNTKESYDKLMANQRAFAAHYKTQPRLPIPEDEWPREWHIADRWRCVNDHVCGGFTRLHYCRACHDKGLKNVDVVRTSPLDDTGPFDFEAELRASKAKTKTKEGGPCPD